MKELLAKHPYLPNYCNLAEMRAYKTLDEDGNILEYWENKDGHWVDCTARKQAEQEVAAAQEQVERLRKAEQLKAKKTECTDHTIADEIEDFWEDDDNDKY